MEAKLAVTQPSHSPPSSQRSIETLHTIEAAFPAIISLVLFSAIFGLIYTYLFEQWQRSLSPKPHDKAICDRCQYFSDNNYIKCALHPVTVLTERAVDCADYCPNHQAERVEKLSKVFLTIRKVFF